MHPVPYVSLGGGGARIQGADPVLATPFRVGEAAAAALAACADAAAEIWQLRGGDEQRVEVDVRAAAASLLGFAFQRVERNPAVGERQARTTTALYPARDGRWIHLHGGFPHLRAGTLEVLDCDDTPESVRRARRFASRACAG